MCNQRGLRRRLAFLALSSQAGCTVALMNANKTYQSFLLRLWCGANAQWRASLEDPHTGDRQAFASLALLAEYLARATECGFAAAEPELAGPSGQDQAEFLGASE
jgi:hypothetical protein